MAKIGLKYPVYKTEDSQGVIGKAIQADISITVKPYFSVPVAFAVGCDRRYPETIY